MFFIRVGIFIDSMSYISNSSEKSQKPHAVQYNMNHVGTIFIFFGFSGSFLKLQVSRYFQVAMVIKFIKFAGSYDY